MTRRTALCLIILASFFVWRCDEDALERGIADPSLVVGKTEQMTGCNPAPGSTLQTQPVVPDLLYIQNLDRKYYSLTEKGDSVIHVIISTQKEYERYIGIISGKDRPMVDFSKYNLIGSSITIFKCAFLEDLRLTDGCEGYVFKTTLWTGECERAITKLTRFMLVEKQDLPIQFMVEYNNNFKPSQLGEILTDDSCLTGQTANLDARPLLGSIRNITWQDVSEKYGLKTEAGDAVMALIISNENDYEKYIGTLPGRIRPDIDFSKEKIVGYILDARKCVALRSTVFESGCNGIIIKATYWRGDCDSVCLCGEFMIIPNTSPPVKVRIKYVY